MSNTDRLKNTLFWGVILWLIGYIAGIILFFVVPKSSIGLIITPLATIFTLWVLIKKIKHSQMVHYFRLSLIWTIMAIALDYIFIVQLFKTGSSYYKPDVFLYYFLTFTLPLIVGFWKYKRNLLKKFRP